MSIDLSLTRSFHLKLSHTPTSLNLHILQKLSTPDSNSSTFPVPKILDMLERIQHHIHHIHLPRPQPKDMIMDKKAARRYYEKEERKQRKLEEKVEKEERRRARGLEMYLGPMGKGGEGEGARKSSFEN